MSGLSSMRTFTHWRSRFTSVTVPRPSGVSTNDSFLGAVLRRSSYASCSYLRQHMSRPHVPEIFVGLRLRFCVLAILMETGWKSSRNSLQQNGLPHTPRPPTIFALSLTPICRSSMRVRKEDARSLTSSRKSTRPSAVKKKRILLPSNATSAETSCMSSLWSAIFCWQTSKARFSFS